MNKHITTRENPEWFAIRTQQDFRAEEVLKPLCDEVFFPKEVISVPGKRTRIKAIIPHVLFVKTTRSNVLVLEKNGRQYPETSIPLWIYRYPANNEIQVIPQSSIDLLRLITSDTTTKCEIFNNTDFKGNEHVRVTGGFYKGFEGYVQRVRKNKHVIVKIEGICLVMLPFIHPKLLEVID